jgi:hypothetical protein
MRDSNPVLLGGLTAGGLISLFEAILVLGQTMMWWNLTSDQTQAWLTVIRIGLPIVVTKDKQRHFLNQKIMQVPLLSEKTADQSTLNFVLLTGEKNDSRDSGPGYIYCNSHRFDVFSY